MSKDISLSDEQRLALEERLVKAAVDNRINCAGALAIAKALGIPSQEVGRAADRLDIRIANCQLGCF